MKRKMPMREEEKGESKRSRGAGGAGGARQGPGLRQRHARLTTIAQYGTALQCQQRRRLDTRSDARTAPRLHQVRIGRGRMKRGKERRGARQATARVRQRVQVRRWCSNDGADAWMRLRLRRQGLAVPLSYTNPPASQSACRLLHARVHVRTWDGRSVSI